MSYLTDLVKSVFLEMSSELEKIGIETFSVYPFKEISPDIPEVAEKQFVLGLLTEGLTDEELTECRSLMKTEAERLEKIWREQKDKVQKEIEDILPIIEELLQFTYSSKDTKYDPDYLERVEYFKKAIDNFTPTQKHILRKII